MFPAFSKSQHWPFCSRTPEVGPAWIFRWGESIGSSLVAADDGRTLLGIWKVEDWPRRWVDLQEFAHYFGNRFWVFSSDIFSKAAAGLIGIAAWDGASGRDESLQSREDWGEAKDQGYAAAAAMLHAAKSARGRGWKIWNHQWNRPMFNHQFNHTNFAQNTHVASSEIAVPPSSGW